MLTVRKPAPNRIDLTLDGKLDTDDMVAGLDALVAALEGVEHGVMLYRIRNFTMPTLGAISAEMMNLPAIWGMVSRLDRCAVISDTGWIRTAAEIEGAVIPGLAIKAFPPEEVAEAEAWLADPA